MPPIVVASLGERAGKTAFCVGLGKKLQEWGRRVGYLRPVVQKEEQPSESSDAQFVRNILSLKDAPGVINPSVGSADWKSEDTLRQVYDAVAVGKDTFGSGQTG